MTGEEVGCVQGAFSSLQTVKGGLPGPSPSFRKSWRLWSLKGVTGLKAVAHFLTEERE